MKTMRSYIVTVSPFGTFSSLLLQSLLTACVFLIVLVTAQLAKEIDMCAKELEKLYGGLTEEIIAPH